MGHADLRVCDKIFASLPNDTSTVAMKITPASLDALVRDDPETFRDAWGGRWVAVKLARVTRQTLRDLLRDAWAMTAPKRIVSQATATHRAGDVTQAASIASSTTTPTTPPDSRSAAFRRKT